MKQLSALILTSLILCSCRTGRLDEPPRAGTHKYKTEFSFYGSARTYLLHTPPKMNSRQAPLLIVLHGAFSTAKEIEEQSGFSRLADEHGFFVAYPNGIGLFGKIQHWNAGHCCGKAMDDEIDDVSFIESILDDLEAHLPINTNEVYLIGYSNGGMMAHRFSAERASRLSAAAIVSGAINSTTSKKCDWKPIKPETPLPILIMHGTADQTIPFDGGISLSSDKKRNWSSVKDASTFWGNANEDKAPVVTIALGNWGHAWPGPYFTNDPNVDSGMKNYDAAEVIWSFFQDQ